VEAVSGDRGVLAHVDLPGSPRVGRYGVDLQAFEQVALPALAAAQPGGVVVVDELGRMELASAAFREAVSGLLDRDVVVVATVQLHHHPFTDALKRRPDVQVLRSPSTVATPCPSGYWSGAQRATPACAPGLVAATRRELLKGGESIDRHKLGSSVLDRN
jgi:nucleoside-triphosphatase